MKAIIKNEIAFEGNISNPIPVPFANNWAETFNLLLK